MLLNHNIPMKLFPTNKAKHVGQSPGSLLYIGERRDDPVGLTVMNYNADALEEKTLTNIEETLAYKNTPTVTWINVDGLHDVGLIQSIGEHYGIHALVLEDILNTQHRPKLEEHEGYLFVTLKMLRFDEANFHVISEQVSFLLGENFLISFQERPGDVLDPVCARLRGSKKRIHNAGSDYLLYALIDAIVDHYYLVLEGLGEQIETLEDTILEQPHDHALQQIHLYRKELVGVRHAVWPLREVIDAFSRRDLSLIRESTSIYIKDVYDHVLQIWDSVENLREMLAGLVDAQRSSVDAKTNEVMRLLTIIATIFIPLTFVAGIYGMNFNPETSPWNMPELNWTWGYPAVWGLMVAVTIGMVVYFKKKGWF